MPFLDEIGLQRFWEHCRDWFANDIAVTHSESTVDISIIAADDDTLATASINVVTTSAAGLMSTSDKAKLDGIASGATANVGTITEVRSSTPISGSATSGSVTISHDDSGVTADTYGTTSTTALTPSFGSTFTVPGFAVNSTGHVTSAGQHTVRIPSTTATETSAGLMSAADKAKLDSLDESGSSGGGGTSSSSTISVGSGDPTNSTAYGVYIDADTGNLWGWSE